MQLPRFWASNCSDLQLQLPPITAKRAARNPIWISSANSKERSRNWMNPNCGSNYYLIAIFVTMTKNVKRRH
jgi:hypothetical protein